MAGVAPRSARSFLGSGMVGQTIATANGIAQAIERNRPVAPAKSIGPPSVTTSGGTTTYEVTGSGSLFVDVPSGVYICTGTYSVTFSDDVTDLFIDVAIDDTVDLTATSTSASAVAGTPIRCSTSGGVVVTTASAITMTLTLLGGGTVSAESSTLRATRIADA